ncbi:MAG: hypothetical protein WBI07_02400, partial [Mobilitalea sp.]
MKLLNRISDRWTGIVDTVIRFPLTVVLLGAAVISNAIAINAEFSNEYVKFMISVLLGAFLAAGLQLLYEHFFDRPITRIVFMTVTVLFTAGYY